MRRCGSLKLALIGTRPAGPPGSALPNASCRELQVNFRRLSVATPTYRLEPVVV
jgi:hypothetical protein